MAHWSRRVNVAAWSRTLASSRARARRQRAADAPVVPCACACGRRTLHGPRLIPATWAPRRAAARALERALAFPLRSAGEDGGAPRRAGRGGISGMI
eukprot:360667-Chlamydomonas_euryale.AAC.2